MIKTIQRVNSLVLQSLTSSSPLLTCRLLTEYPHIAGSDENHHLATVIYEQWLTYKFDKVELNNFTVYVSYPNQSNPNVLLLKNSDGDVLYNASTAEEPPLTPGENDSTVARPFNAYSGLGNASVSLHASIDMNTCVQ